MENSCKMRKCMAFLILMLGSLFSFAGGGWPQAKGGYFMKWGYYGITADKYFTPAGHLVDITTTGFHSLSYYAEYGITDKLTGILNVPLFVRSTLNRVELPDGSLVEEGDELNSIGDMDLSLKYGWLRKGNLVSAVQLTFGLPVGEPRGGRTGLLQSGDGEFNQLIEVYTSGSFLNGKGFGTVVLGFNNRTRGFSDELRYGFEAGYRVRNFWLIWRSYGVKSFENGTAEFLPNNGIFSNNIEYLSLSPEVLYEVNGRWGISAGAGFAAYGKRILGAPSYSLGFFLKTG